MKSKKLILLMLTPCLLSSNISGMKTTLANQNMQIIEQNLIAEALENETLFIDHAILSDENIISYDSVLNTNEVYISANNLNGLNFSQTRGQGYSEFTPNALKVGAKDSGSIALGYITLKSPLLLNQIQNISFDSTKVSGAGISLQLAIQIGTTKTNLALDSNNAAQNKWWSIGLSELKKPWLIYPFFGTLEDVYTVYPDAKVIAVGYSLGPGQGESLLKSITVNDLKYIFGNTIHVSSINLDESSMSLAPGETRSLTPQINPSSASNKNVTWASSDDSVATVDINGKVKALSKGSSTITVTTEDGTKSATCELTVATPVKQVTSFSLNKGTSFIKTGETDILYAVIAPLDATNQNVIWSTSDPSIVTVDNGVITALSVGNAKITATTEDGKFTSYCYVNITDKTVSVTDVKLKPSTSLNIGGRETLIPSIYPLNASNKNITWNSSDDSIVTVDHNGKINAIEEGTATITATTEDGNKTSSCIVTVKTEVVPIKNVYLEESITLEKGNTEILTPVIDPIDATNQNVTWSSSDDSIASIDDNGKITALNDGTATITVTSEDGGLTADCVVTVNEKIKLVEDIALKPSTSINVGSTEVLMPVISPMDATNKKVTWHSSDNSVITVDDNGKITALKAGNATITVTSDDGNKTASCFVNVNEVINLVSDISLKSSTSIDIGSSEVLTPVINPIDATNKKVTWKSSDSSIVSVSSDGTITALKVGTATITVKTVDGGKTASCVVTVNPVPVANIPVSSISINSGNYSNSISSKGGTLQLNAVVLPSNATDKTVRWRVDSSIASITQNGLVKANADGRVTVSAIDVSGKIIENFIVNISGQNYVSNESRSNNNSSSNNDVSQTNEDTSTEKTVETISQKQIPLLESKEVTKIADDTTPLGTTENKIIFNDISKDKAGWALDAITYLSEKGIIKGTGNNNFEPNRPITRAEFVTLIVKAFDLKPNEKSASFSDMLENDWFYNAVNAGVVNNIINGYSDRTFRPNNPTSREEMASIINRLIEKQKLKLTEKGTKIFKDQEEFADFAKDPIAKLSAYGILNGDEKGFFAPKTNTSRAQSAVVIYNLLKAIEK